MKKDWYKTKTKYNHITQSFEGGEYIYDGTFQRNTEDWCKNYDGKWGLRNPEKLKIHRFYCKGASGRAKRRAIRNKNKPEIYVEPRYRSSMLTEKEKQRRKSQYYDSIRNAYAHETMDLHISALYSITSDSEIYYTKRPVHREMALYMSLLPRFGQKSMLLTQMVLDYFTIKYNN